jgi:hypothetical protein
LLTCSRPSERTTPTPGIDFTTLFLAKVLIGVHLCDVVASGSGDQRNVDLDHLAGGFLGGGLGPIGVNFIAASVLVGIFCFSSGVKG